MLSLNFIGTESANEGNAGEGNQHSGEKTFPQGYMIHRRTRSEVKKNIDSEFLVRLQCKAEEPVLSDDVMALHVINRLLIQGGLSYLPFRYQSCRRARHLCYCKAEEAVKTLSETTHQIFPSTYTSTNAPAIAKLTLSQILKPTAIMENDKGELVDLYVYPSNLASPIWRPKPHQLTNPPRQLRPPQMLRDEPHHQSQRPRLGANLRRQGRRERPVHGGEPSLRAVRVRAGHGRGRRQSEQAGAEGRAGEECVEREFAAVKGGPMCGWGEVSGRS